MILTEIRKSAFWVAGGSAYSSISPMHQSVNPRVAQRPIRSASANRYRPIGIFLKPSIVIIRNLSLLNTIVTWLYLFIIFIIFYYHFVTLRFSGSSHIPISEQPSQPQFVSGFGGSGTTSVASLDESCQVFRRPKMLKLASSLNDFEVFRVIFCHDCLSIFGALLRSPGGVEDQSSHCWENLGEAPPNAAGLWRPVHPPSAFRRKPMPG